MINTVLLVFLYYQYGQLLIRVAYRKLICRFRINRINFDHSAIHYGRIKGTLDIEKLCFQQYLKKLNVKHLAQITPKSF